MTRAIPDDNLAYPVLLTGHAESGSGFYLNSVEATYLVTARHVLFRNNSDDPLSKSVTFTSYSSDPNDRTPNILTLDTDIALANKTLRGHTSHDVAIARIAAVESGSSKSRKVNTVPGAQLKSVARAGVVGVAMASVKHFTDVMIANETVILGYPTSLGLQRIPQIDYQRPLLRRGIVAGKNDAKMTIVLDCPVYKGNSGGIVLEIEEDQGMKHYRCIGVIAEYVPVVPDFVNPLPMGMHIPIGNSGYSIATPMDPVIELLNLMETT